MEKKILLVVRHRLQQIQPVILTQHLVIDRLRTTLPVTPTLLLELMQFIPIQQVYGIQLLVRPMQNNTYGSYNTAIGYNSGVNCNNYYATALGHLSVITGNYQVRIGPSNINSIGGYASWSNLSDRRVKTKIQENVPGLEFILKLTPVTYNLDISTLNNFLQIPDSLLNNEFAREGIRLKETTVQTGFIAQDVEEVAQSLGYDFSGVDAPINENDMYGLRYAEFVVPLVKGMQEQQMMIKNLQRENIELKNRIAKLEGK